MNIKKIFSKHLRSYIYVALIFLFSILSSKVVFSTQECTAYRPEAYQRIVSFLNKDKKNKFILMRLYVYVPLPGEKLSPGAIYCSDPAESIKDYLLCTKEEVHLLLKVDRHDRENMILNFLALVSNVLDDKKATAISPSHE